jgi:glutamyl/glutaminyl-tRNA synthetase
MYTFAHPIEDALENITHSICTLEFEDQRPFYDWLLERLAEGGLLQRPLPQQIEFSRLNLTYVVLSKRKLIQLVEEKHVDGWDDPRMPTLVGARRRGYSAEGFRLFAERIGVSKNDSLIDYVLFEDAMREVMNESDQRRIAVLDPLKLIIDNYPEGQVEDCSSPTTRCTRNWASAPCPSAANCGSKARTSWKCRARASAASSRATWRACVRLRRRMHRLRQGRERQGCRRALHLPARNQVRHAGRRQRQGQGQPALGFGRARLPGRNPPLRPPVQGPGPRRPP